MLKVGSKVRYEGKSGDYFTKGEEYTISDIKDYEIILEDNGTKNPIHSWSYPVFFDNFCLLNSLEEEQVKENSSTIPAKRFKRITGEMLRTFIKKNQDYGDSFFISCNEEGLAASRIRIGDKWLRFKKLSKGGEAMVKDESIRDTLLDMANYAIMTVMWMDNQKKGV
ncbi:hypothetical protein [uncultured phage cr106_1]|uniref:Nucleotide modification associated domain-containing protein n=1 Tax=uncultured phage cr106_1 TaxID=2772062 RepID=A0A7M1RZ81_9CAUD|nr:VOG4966 [uncultured phage cr106_1]QOR58330.1 hypothetical protein [uncultured phage cr106_1]